MHKDHLSKLIRLCVKEVLNEGILDNMMDNAVPIQVPSQLKDKLLGMGNVLAGGYENQVSDDVKITAAIVYYMTGEKRNLFDTATTFHSKGIQ